MCPLNQTCDPKVLMKFADEFYLGISDPSWESAHSKFVSPNTRGNSHVANYYDMDRLEHDLRLLNSFDKGSYLTLNSHSYSHDQLGHLKRFAAMFKDMGGTGLICSEPYGMSIAKELGLRAIASTNFALYNSRAVRWVVENLGAKRVVLSRDTTFDEIRDIRESTDAELETFIEHFGCRFSNGLCMSTHIPGSGGMCRVSVEGDWEYNSSDPDVRANHAVYSDKLLIHACGYCAIYDFCRIGIDSVKIVGRELEGLEILRSARNVSSLIDLAVGCKSKREYLERMDSCIDMGFQCNRYNCYYPELGRWSNRNH